MAELIIREKKKHFGIPRKILVNGRPLCTMKAQEIRLQLPPAQYCITIQSIVPSFCAVKYVSVSEETDNVLEFSDREKWWDLVFTADMFLWLAKIFLDLQKPYSIIYEIVSDTLFAVWLIREWRIRGTYFDMTVSHPEKSAQK